MTAHKYALREMKLEMRGTESARPIINPAVTRLVHNAIFLIKTTCVL